MIFLKIRMTVLTFIMVISGTMISGGDVFSSTQALQNSLCQLTSGGIK